MVILLHGKQTFKEINTYMQYPTVVYDNFYNVQSFKNLLQFKLRDLQQSYNNRIKFHFNN